MTLGSQNQRAGQFAAQVVAAIAAIELPHDQWQDLIEVLLGFVNNQQNVNIKKSTLQAIGFICEQTVRLSPFDPHYASSTALYGQ